MYCVFCYGADGRTRTDDIIFTKDGLYQLSYVGAAEFDSPLRPTALRGAKFRQGTSESEALRDLLIDTTFGMSIDHADV